MSSTKVYENRAHSAHKRVVPFIADVSGTPPNTEADASDDIRRVVVDADKSRQDIVKGLTLDFEGMWLWVGIANLMPLAHAQPQGPSKVRYTYAKRSAVVAIVIHGTNALSTAVVSGQ